MILSKKIRIYPTETQEKKLKQAINTKKIKL
ncbi:helix-turn-helix domain-containing protein [Leptotrichia sp. oral taxon 223]|nr:helix-turn-helix domain-containing protein [Leptotrichia sp. oral taxon 223]